MINLHIIGDSHARIETWGGIQIEGLNIICHYLPGKTCVAFSTERPSISDMGVKKEDWVCFCFGWIDCWFHVMQYNDNYKQIIDKIADLYFYTLKQIDVSKIFVFNITPAVPYEIESEKGDKRNYIKYMNKCLKKKCEETGFIYFDVYDKYVGDKDFFNTEYKDNCVHIKNPVFLTEFLKKFV